MVVVLLTHKIYIDYCKYEHELSYKKVLLGPKDTSFNYIFGAIDFGAKTCRRRLFYLSNNGSQRSQIYYEHGTYFIDRCCMYQCIYVTILPGDV